MRQKNGYLSIISKIILFDFYSSGVALARLASQQHQSLVIDTAAQAAAVEAMAEAAKKQNGGSQLSPGEIIRSSGQPAFPQGM